MKLLKFYADWCLPCKQMAPILEEANQVLDYDILEVDIELDPELSEEYAVRSVPTFILVDNTGAILKRFTGKATKDQLIESLKCRP